MIDQDNVPGAQLRLSNLDTQGIGQYPYDTNAGILQPNELRNVVYYFNANGQLYLDTQGTHTNEYLENTGVDAARSDDATQQQRNPLRRQLNPPVMQHVLGNCHRCGRTYNEVALYALGAYLAATENPGETV